MKQVLRAYKYFLAIMVVDGLVFLWNRAVGWEIFSHTYFNFKEMLSVIPPIFILLGLLDVWVSREKVIKYLGERSGLIGLSLVILLGAAAAGPLYGAFPIAAVMAKKGTSYFNILVFIGAWSTLKIPMFLFEMSALGAKFAVTRLVVNVPGIVLIAWIMNLILTPEEKARIQQAEA